MLVLNIPTGRRQPKFGVVYDGDRYVPGYYIKGSEVFRSEGKGTEDPLAGCVVDESAVLETGETIGSVRYSSC